MIETPDTVHGRLLEAVHIAGYTWKRACDELDWILDDERWKQVGGGFDDINAFLATIDLSEFRIAVEQRKGLARKLEALRATNVSTAKALGVEEGTIRLDLGKKRQPDKSEVAPLESALTDEEAQGGSDKSDSSPLRADELPAWFQGDADPAELAKARTKRSGKEAEREAKRERNRELVELTPRALAPTDRFATIALDPPWDWGDEGDVDQFGRATPTYSTLTFDEIAAWPVAHHAERDAHLYLWITNRSLPKGFTLLERWGFRYVTAITWVKPSIGMGNYYRGSTEHVLFGVRGALPLLRNDVGTFFSAPRPGVHSGKPDAFYALVESCSPGPWLEWFARSERPGWVTVGAEVAA